MPIYESTCGQHRFEWFAHNRETPDPACRECGQPTRRLISRFAAIWTKNLSDYGDSTKETYAKDQKLGGHWQYRKRSEGGTPDKPIPVFLETHQQQRDFCRAEGLLSPDEVGNIQVDKSGETCHSEGMPGQWV